MSFYFKIILTITNDIGMYFLNKSGYYIQKTAIKKGK